MIRLKFRDDGVVFEKMLLEDRPDVGPEIRQEDAPGCEAGSSQPLDLPFDHCPACCATIAEQIGLSEDDVQRLKRWRSAHRMSPDERRTNRMTAGELGGIIDRIVAKLEAYDMECDAECYRIVVEVEPTP